MNVISFGDDKFILDKPFLEGHIGKLATYEEIREFKLLNNNFQYYSTYNGWNDVSEEDYRELRRRVLCQELCSAETLT